MNDKLLFDHPMTAKEQYEFWQDEADNLEEVGPIDEEERKMIKEWRSYRLEDFKDETEEDFKKRQQDTIDLKNNFKKAQNELKKTKPMTINTNIAVINKIKEKADNIGINYQSLINVLLKQYADGRINIIL